MARALDFFASCPRGLETVLADELSAMGARGVRAARAGVAFMGPLSTGLRACMWSRVASRVLLKLATVPASTADELYTGVHGLPWEAHLALEGTFAVSVVGTSPALRHTGFTALRVKDAIVDRFRELYGSRPNVDPSMPDVRVSVRLLGKSAIVSIDLSGIGLHKRGYREPGVQVEAPMKENLAAGMLALAGWTDIARSGGAFVDPMCGSATLGIEAAWMASDTAPGLLREHWGFSGWLGRDDAIWATLVREARQRSEAGLARGLPPILCSDSDERAIDIASAFVGRAGLDGVVSIARRDLTDLKAPTGVGHGLVATNPPYGGRLGQRDSLRQLYGWMRERLDAQFPGWVFAVISGDPRIGDGLDLIPTHTAETFNGSIPVTVSIFDVPGPKRRAREQARGTEGPRAAFERGGRERGAQSRPPLDTAPAVADGRSAAAKEASQAAAAATALPRGLAAESFENRLRKMSRHYDRWARRSGVSCYRVYDADLPDYAVAIDVYNGAGPDAGRRWVHVAEYAPPADIDPSRAESRMYDVVSIAPSALGVAPEDLFVKQRRRQRGADQYQRLGRAGAGGIVEEDGLLFEVNFSDYIDTGLFLDHRVTRHMLREMAEGARFLNLFCYTGSASVYAAAGGAISTTSVDMSPAYLEWATRNMALNGFEGSAHKRVREDVVAWLDAPELAEERYDLIFLDPPTFSNSKRMAETLDVQRDHVSLISSACRLLATSGTLVFSSNRRRFKMDEEGLAASGLSARDITPQTVPRDFEGRKSGHVCWTVRRA